MSKINLSKYWLIKITQYLKLSNIPIAKKVLAYKIFLRPILTYYWFHKNCDKVEYLEVQALRTIFKKHSTKHLYNEFSDIDIRSYQKIEGIKWRKATGLDLGTLRRLLQSSSKFLCDPSVYFRRAAERSKKGHLCRISSRGLKFKCARK